MRKTKNKNASKNTNGIILASGSPRRLQLLTQAGFKCAVIAPKTEEIRKRGETPRAYAMRNAREKCAAVANKFETPALIIAADTIVVCKNAILEKPKNDTDARKMLRKLSGNTHDVLTAYCCHKMGKQINKVVRTRVKFRDLSKQEIDQYIATGEGRDKSGSYAAQGKGASFIEAVFGSYTNVIGLPIAQVIETMQKL